MATPKRPRRVEPGEPLNSTEAELDAASVVTEQDIARAMDAAPDAIRPYLEARPASEGDAPA